MTATPPRFACDAMLGYLARWLRAAGYDVFWQEGIDDTELVRLAQGADVLLCEATFAVLGEGSPDYHLAAGEAGEHAARAGAGRLILTHIWPTHDRSAARDRAGAAFDGPVMVAEDGLKVKL